MALTLQTLRKNERNANIPMRFKNWIVNRERMGRPCFCHAEVAEAFPSLSTNAIDAALSRFRARGLVQTVHRGFYCVVPAQYALAGAVPPFYYIDALMRRLGKPYYAALLSAAALWGASHQKVMVTQIMTELPRASTSPRRNPSIDWLYRKRVPAEFVVRKNGENGPVAYSDAQLTALDLVRYADRAGGLSFVASVLAELKERTDFSGAGRGVFRTASAPDVQRLGWLYGEVLGDGAQADVVRRELARSGAQVRLVDLRPGAPSGGAPVDRTWRLRVNAEIETEDEP